MDEGSSDIETGLVDLTDMDLTAIDMLGDSALARSLRRVIRLAERADEDVTGFRSSII